jgi:hypothetical protein
MDQATALVGGHSNANVTALDWHPVSSSVETKNTPPLLLASGDTDGRVIIWDVLQGTPIAALEDAFYAGFGSADGGPRRADSTRVPVKALAWSTARNLLTILLAPGYLLLWDYRSGGVIWRRDLGPSDAFNSMQTDPCDRRRVVLSTPQGAFAALRLDAPSVDKIKFQRFQAEIAASGTLKCALPGTRDILLLLLQRELIAFDLEYGQPVASTSLPSGLPAFDSVLGSFGHSIAGVSPREAGIDALYCSHVDGSVSTWQRKEGTLVYSLKSHVPLAPSMLAKAAGILSSGGGGGGGGGSPGASTSSLVAIVAGTWPSSSSPTNSNSSLYDGDFGSESSGGRAPAFGVLKKKLSQSSTSGLSESESGTASHLPGHIRSVLPGTSHPSSPQDTTISSTTTPSGTSNTISNGVNSGSVLVLALAADGALWQWQLPLLSGTIPAPSSSTTRASIGEESTSQAEKSQEARLLGCHHSLTHTVTAFSAFPGILALPNNNNSNDTSTPTATGTYTRTAGVCVVGTASGTLELVTIQRGRLIPLTLSVASSLAVHPHSTPVAGLRWLGPTSRVASFSSQRSESTGDWVNTLMITDFRSGGSFPFRDGGLDKGPLTGLRASPSGAHLLLLFRGLPSEVWATPEGAAPFRLRQIDLNFTSVEWILPEKEERRGSSSTGTGSGGDEDGTAVIWKVPSPAEEAHTSSYSSPSQPIENTQNQQQPTSPRFPSEDFPEEKIVFTLSDGRVGVLSVYGRRIQDTKPRMPSWPQLASGEFRATCAASYGHLVFLGGSDGLLVRWDTLSGRTLAVDAGCGRIHGLVIAPISQKESVDQSEIARVAVLAASGAYAVLALDITGQLRPTAATWAAGGATLGRAQGIDWVSLPQPYGSGCVLAVAVESGSLALVDVTGKRKQHGSSGSGKEKKILELAGAPKLISPLLLPRDLRLVLRIMIQRGVPAALLRNAVEIAAATTTKSSSTITGLSTEGFFGSTNTSITTTTSSPAYLKIESELRARLPRGCAAVLSPTAAEAEREQGTTPTSEAAEYTSFIGPRSTSSGEVAATGTMAALLESGGGAGGVGAGGINSSMLLDSGGIAGSPMRSGSGIEQAAMKLGYSGLGGKNSGVETKKIEKLKSFGGAVGGAVKTIAKDVASASKDQLNRRLRAGSGAIPDDFDPNNPMSSSSSLSMLPSPPPPLPLVPLGGGANLGGGNNRRSSLDTPRCGSLAAALAKCAQVRCLEYPLTENEMVRYEAALASTSTGKNSSSLPQRMELAAAISGCPEEARFWQRVPASLKHLHSLNSSANNNNSEAKSTNSEEFLLWSSNVELAEATERSNWHAKLSRRIFESSESLQEKRVLEFLSLGDLQAAVGFLLASPPARSARYYRDALCTLGMAFACGLSSTQQQGQGQQQQQQNEADGTSAPTSTTTTQSGNSTQVLDAAARTLFVQAAKIVSANAAGVGDTLLGVPLMCATGEFDDAVNILQDAGMWSYAAALAAGSLPHAVRAGPLDRWATHVADAEGRLWSAVGLLVGAGLIGDAAELLMQNGLADAAAALIEAAKEELANFEKGDDGGSGDGDGGEKVSGYKIEIDEKTAAAVEMSYESFITHVLQNL